MCVSECDCVCAFMLFMTIVGNSGIIIIYQQVSYQLVNTSQLTKEANITVWIVCVTVCALMLMFMTVVGNSIIIVYQQVSYFQIANISLLTKLANITYVVFVCIV